MAQQQGRQANQNGIWAENDIAGRLINHGYQDLTPLPKSKRRKGYSLPLVPDGVAYFIRQKHGPFVNLYGRPMKVDFYVWHPEKYPDGLIIESKSQEDSGSVDEKFPYLIWGLKATGIPSILLLLCPGAKPYAIAWCLQQQEGQHFRVFPTWETFTAACNRGLL